MNSQNIVIIATSLILFACILTFTSVGDNKEARSFKPENSIHRIYAEAYNKNVESMMFEEWCEKYNMRYSNQAERRFRKIVYHQQLIDIKQHNIKFQLGLSTYFKGVNQFTAMTNRQFIDKFTWKRAVDIKATNICKGSVMDTPNPPPSLDWLGKVNEVAQQGECGKDWAMVAVNAVQSLYALKIGVLPVLSVQQVLQCSYSYGNEGCNGGFMDQAFWYIIDNGITTQTSYPSIGNKTQSCHYAPNMKFTSFSQCARVPSGSYSKLLSAIVQQPVSVAVNLHEDMKGFKDGIYDGNCTNIVNHAMLLTGYGVEGNTLFWKLKNTMGTQFAQNGYIKIKREAKDGDGKCGIQMWASLPQILS